MAEGSTPHTPAPLPVPVGDAHRMAWRDGAAERGVRRTAEETPVALVHDGSTSAVMMATPQDLEDFAVGFSLTEGIVADIAQVRGVEVEVRPRGLEVRVWLSAPQTAALASRRRRIAGPTGCGLCGVESLEEAVRRPRRVEGGPRLTPGEVLQAMGSLETAQPLGAETRAMHAAGFWTPGDGLVALREDVGRHNALDKLVGAMVRAGRPAADGAILLTSRVSVEMVQKAAAAGGTMVIAVSAPTALAIRTAQDAGVTLVGVARRDGFEVFTHPWRIAFP